MSENPADAPGDGWVKLGRYNSATEAEFDAGVLGAEGIPTQVLGANINMVDWFWQGFNPVDVFLPADDRRRALDILARRCDDELEPAEGSKPQSANGRMQRLPLSRRIGGVSSLGRCPIKRGLSGDWPQARRASRPVPIGSPLHLTPMSNSIVS